MRDALVEQYATMCQHPFFSLTCQDELDYQAALAARAALAGERGRLSAEEKAALLQRGKEARQQQESKRVDRNWVGLGEREKKEAAVKFMQVCVTFQELCTCKDPVQAAGVYAAYAVADAKCIGLV